MIVTESIPQKWIAPELAALGDIELNVSKLLATDAPSSGGQANQARGRAHDSPWGSAQSRPVDLDLVNARLLDFEGQSNISPRPSPLASPLPSASTQLSGESTQLPTPPEIHAAIFHDKLNPEGYQDILQPWQEWPGTKEPEWDVFWDQCKDWELFRRWQKQNRTSESSHTSDPERQDTFDVFMTHFCHELVTYEEGIGRLFAHYSLSQPHQIHEDPDDKLSTWVEYLAFTCCAHYKLLLRQKRQKPGFDAAWEALLNTEFFKASDTMESIFSMEATIERQSERYQARQAVESAKAALRSRPKRQDFVCGASSDKPILGIVGTQTAQSRLSAAEKALDSTSRRLSALGQFSVASGEYRKTQRLVACRSNRIGWVLDRMPLVEAEVNELCRAKRKHVERDDTDKPNGNVEKCPKEAEAYDMLSRCMPKPRTDQSTQKCHTNVGAEARSLMQPRGARQEMVALDNDFSNVTSLPRKTNMSEDGRDTSPYKGSGEMLGMKALASVTETEPIQQQPQAKRRLQS
ncbi:hypothetical protein F5Y08DRAFT_341881 [Xylaria arbuscula]|nr:hypothetical protein F5Y08DRAFT_341881 [Xylaria arbuscula]